MDIKKVEFTLDFGPNWRVFVLAFANPHWTPEHGLFHRSGPWSWCAYAEFNHEHPLFNKGENFWHEHMYGGCTYSRVTEMSELSEYDAERGRQPREVKINKVGMDFQHLYDDFYDCDPVNGIPFEIKSATDLLIATIKGA